VFLVTFHWVTKLCRNNYLHYSTLKYEKYNAWM
jgi:hypothetical protein